MLDTYSSGMKWLDTYTPSDHVDLTEIRRAAGMTPRELAEAMGYQGERADITVRQMETRPDWLVSRLAAYIQATGGMADLVVTVNGERITFNLV